MIEFHFFFWNANKNFRVAGKKLGRSGNRVTGNTHIFFLPKTNDYTMVTISIYLSHLLL